jgi:hypothetical protein
MSQRRVTPASYLSDHRRVNCYHFWMPIKAIIRSTSPLMLKKNSIHHTFWDLLLYQDGIQAEEWGSNLSEVYPHHLGASNWEKHRSLLDDVVVKLKKHGDLLNDLKETFNNLRKYKIMLNPKNVCSLYYQEICSAIWYHLREST